MSDYPRCSVCGQYVGGPSDPPGTPAPIHRQPGEQGQCPGSGQPTQ
ncbi:hypothetical protein DFQ14_101278 [Halopolyspora algeriensis]|uniref:Uncharacterized protein n=1 Tax=Halopolyspora algeriensis TaxID=1500506 RepID=A0A368VXK5_9ACTN|nr:hypothetical protein [Halopolyspora algeriensis]RCW46938.1 hypothetical protein DFQ14_101278 [Halopolyspora algeriensis]TQM48029.1 hypothetical protein FHU43_2981 [Halopolyspora algeriensis]